MMNSFSAGFYLPVPVTDDPSKKIFFLSPEHQKSIEAAFSNFDELKSLQSIYKINHFMMAKDIDLRGKGHSKIRAIKSCPRSEEYLKDAVTYEKWLEDKVFLRTERFFSGRPGWNIASTRHALMGEFQFKGIGFTGITGRCDFPHIHGNLDIYLSLYETVMSWHLSTTPLKAQRVVALWKDDDKKNPKVLMLREANSFRLAQLDGVDLQDDEKALVFKSLQVSSAHDLQSKFLKIVQNYAWLVAHSYEAGSPTLDNLMLDGSLIDCSSMLHYNEGQWCFPLHLSRQADGTWVRSFDSYRGMQGIIRATHRIYRQLGMELELQAAENEYWKVLSSYVGENAKSIQTYFEKLPKDESLSFEEWQKRLSQAFPQATITIRPPEQSRHDSSENVSNLMVLIAFAEGPNKKFNAFQVTDSLLQVLALGSEGIDPMEFAKSIFRVAVP